MWVEISSGVSSFRIQKSPHPKESYWSHELTQCRFLRCVLVICWMRPLCRSGMRVGLSWDGVSITWRNFDGGLSKTSCFGVDKKYESFAQTEKSRCKFEPAFSNWPVWRVNQPPSLIQSQESFLLEVDTPPNFIGEEKASSFEWKTFIAGVERDIPGSHISDERSHSGRQGNAICSLWHKAVMTSCCAESFDVFVGSELH